MVSFMAEGCVADWSAIYFKEVLHSPKALISLGYAGFSCAMTFGRLNGDALFAKFGSKKLVVGGSLLASVGFLTVVLAPGISIAVAGYILIGFGCCCIVPILFRAAANIPGLSPVEGFAMVTTGGLVGFLAGPSIIGFISEQMGLSKALSLLIFMTLFAALAAWRNKFIGGKNAEISNESFDDQIY
jgi:MFS family permease